jgi:RHS repeat-associated protein
MWSESITGTSIRQRKHVYVGQTRVATRLNHKYQSDTGYEQANTYYYHPDHLGSAQLVTDPDGQEYEHLEYTPYGELWVEQTRDGIELIPFRFTGKELDSETGLYYYGARYLDPKTSVWLSADPALGEYVPGAPIDDEAKKRNGNLPGMGGVFNTVNLHLYHYAGNNPIKYTDPDGKETAAAQQLLESIPENLPPSVGPSAAGVAARLSPWVFILSFLACLQGDSVQPVLPANYVNVVGVGIVAPNGTVIATPDQARKHSEGSEGWEDVEGWGAGSWGTSNRSLLKHYERHGDEVGASSPAQYLRKALAFASNLKGAKSHPQEGYTEDVTRYHKNGKYIDIASNGDIVSFGKE